MSGYWPPRAGSYFHWVSQPTSSPPPPVVQGPGPVALSPHATAITGATVVVSTPAVPLLSPHAGAAAAATATVTAAAAPSLTAVAFFGDSFTDGNTNGDPQSVRFATKTAALLSVTELNYGKGGARQNLNRVSGAADILTQVYQAAQPRSSAPYAPMYQAAVIQCSINNLNLNTVHADLTIVTRALLRAIRRIRAAGSYEALPSTGGPWTFDSGSWTDVPTIDANTGTGIERATANGCRSTVVLPGDFPGGQLRVYGPMTQGFGAIETFTVDTAANGTSDNRGSALQSGSQPWEHKTGPLIAGAHTVRSTVGSINTVENINGADFETAARPLVIVLNTARSPNYPGGEYSMTDADVNNSNAAVTTALLKEFGSDHRVILLDMDAVLARNPANFGADGVHPNSTGTSLIAAAIASAISTAASNPSRLVRTQVATDAFQRADGTLTGGNWAAASDGSAAISSGEVIGTNAVIKGNYRTGETYNSDQYSQVTIGSIANVGGAFVGPTVRNQPDGSSCYAAIYLRDGTPPHVNFYKRTAPGAFTMFAQHKLGVSNGLNSGDVLTLVAEGPQLTLLINGVGAFTTTDATLTGGTPGVTTFNAVTLDNWEGGNAATTALPAATVTDNFNRADGGMSAGQANWQVMSGYPATDPPIVSNQIVVNPSLQHQAATRTDTWVADQWSAIQMGSVLPSVNAAGFVGLTLRVNPGLNSGYLLCYFNQSDNTSDGGNAKSSYRIYRLDAGVSHVLASCGSTEDGNAVFNPAGTLYTAVAEGSRLSLRVNGREVVAAIDSTYPTGKPGVQFYPATTGQITADNWSAGPVH